jgi:DNA-binding transcriptional MerR regulator
MPNIPLRHSYPSRREELPSAQTRWHKIMIGTVDKMMRIGELAKQARVTPRTVRYYGSLGLIPPGEREGAGQHRYPEQTVARLQKIDQLKALGLSLEEIGKVIHLYFDDPTGKKAKTKVLELLRGSSRRNRGTAGIS